MLVGELIARLPPDCVTSFVRTQTWNWAAQQGIDWPAAAVSAEAVQAAKLALPAAAASTLELIINRIGIRPFDEEQLLASAARERWTGAEIRCGLRELQCAGIVFTVRKSWGERMHFIARDSFVHWLQQFKPLRLRPLPLEEAMKIRREGSNRPPLSLQWLGALAELRLEGMRLTAKGMLPKKTVKRMLQRIAATDEELAGWQPPLAHAEEYPLTIRLLLDMALQSGWLVKESEQYRFDADVWQRWLCQPAESREAGLIQSFVCRYDGSNPLLASAGAALGQLSGGEWFKAAEVRQWMEQFNYPRAARQEQGEDEGAEVSGLLQAWSAFGWIELGYGANDEELFRWLVNPALATEDRQLAEAEPIRILPSGEVLLTRDCTAQARWRMEMISTIVTDDYVSVYRITPASFAAALAEGETSGTLVDFLSEAGGEPVPDTLAAELAGWSERIGQIEFAQVTLLRCKSAEAAQRIAKEPAIAPMLLQRIGEQDFIVAADEVKEIRKRLDRIGFPVLAKAQQGDDQTAAPGAKQAVSAEVSAGLLLDRNALYYYSIDPVLPDTEGIAEELFPGLRQIPAPWVDHLRTYHPSTRLEMIEQALSWQVPLELKTGHEGIVFMPARVQKQDGQWTVAGRVRRHEGLEQAEIQLDPGMWDQMRLIIPGRDKS
ncbi:hypothetical protein EBB07_32635 [Paenibacillaceae bacterium]|nr:hypothetical protein EBB07_32635 [Paenibacillaceae bacterium]